MGGFWPDIEVSSARRECIASSGKGLPERECHLSVMWVGMSIECSYGGFMEDRIVDGCLTEVSVDGGSVGVWEREERIYGVWFLDVPPTLVTLLFRPSSVRTSASGVTHTTHCKGWANMAASDWWVAAGPFCGLQLFFMFDRSRL